MCRPYGFGNHVDMTDVLRPITNSGIWIPMLAPTCSTMISSDEPRCRGFNQSRMQFPLSNGMLLARDSIVGIPIPCSISLPASLFTRSVTHIIPWSTPWSHCAHYDDVLPSGPRDTSPFTQSDKSQSRFVPTQQTLSEIPVVYLYIHPVTLWRLVHPKHSYGIRELHNLMV